MSGIQFKSISKRYGTQSNVPLAVNSISFEIAKGSLTTLLGPSGCGKTTTLRMLAGLESPTAGEIWIDGKNVTRLGPAERNVSMMFQSYALFPHMSVLANVMYGLKMSSVAKPEALRRAQETLKTVGLVGFDERLPSELSGGQQQRVALARALVLEPAVLLFDEPLSNLDARLRRNMREEIRSLQQRLGLTVAYVTHDQSEALAVSDQIIVMNQGQIAQMGSPRDLYENPQTAFVAGFMGEAALWPAYRDATACVHLGASDAAGAQGDALTWVDTSISTINDPATTSSLRPTGSTAAFAMAAAKGHLAVRPEAWKIFTTHEPPAGNSLPATLIKSAYLGNCWEYHLETALGTVFVVSSQVARHFAVGSTLLLQLKQHGVAWVS
jgi:iron(III) transport system ATP-binding protein